MATRRSHELFTQTYTDIIRAMDALALAAGHCKETNGEPAVGLGPHTRVEDSLSIAADHIERAFEAQDMLDYHHPTVRKIHSPTELRNSVPGGSESLSAIIHQLRRDSYDSTLPSATSQQASA